MRFLLLALLLLAGGVFGLLAQLDHDVGHFIIAALLQGGIWAVAAALVARGAGRRSLVVILATAVLLRLIALAAPVYLSDDIYRYIWDGRVQAAGINPYRYIPTDTHLAPLRDQHQLDHRDGLAKASRCEKQHLRDRRVDRRRIVVAVDIWKDGLIAQRHEVCVGRNIAVWVDPRSLDTSIPDVAVDVVREIDWRCERPEAHQGRRYQDQREW